MTYICVELISGKEDVFQFFTRANAAKNAHMLNKIDPSGRWVVMPRVPWGAYTKIPLRFAYPRGGNDG